MESLFARLPHRPPMLLLEGVDEGGAFLRVDPAAWYADAAGAMPGWIGLEVMAQAAAALAPREAGAPRKGYLVGTRAYRSLPAFPAGSLLRVRVEADEAEGPGLAVFACEILLGEEIAASATLKVIRP